MLVRFAATIAVLLTTLALVAGPGGTAAGLDISGTWDAEYALTCDAVFDHDDTTLSVDIDCGAGATGTLQGSANSKTGLLSLSGLFGVVSISLDGVITDNASLNGTFAAPPLAESGAFSAVRVGSASGPDLDGAWTITLVDIFSGDCTVRLDQTGTALDGVLACDAFSDVALNGTFDGSALTLIGELRPEVPVGIEATISEDGGSAEGTWSVGPEGVVELSGSFSGTLRGGPNPTAGPIETDVPAPTATPLLTLPSTGTGPQAGQLGVGVAVLASLGACLALAGMLLRPHKSVSHI